MRTLKNQPKILEIYNFILTLVIDSKSVPLSVYSNMTTLFRENFIQNKNLLLAIFTNKLTKQKKLPAENSFLLGEEECADSESQNWEVFTGGSWQADPTAKVGPTKYIGTAKSKNPKNCRQIT